MAKNDLPVADTQGTRGTNVVELAVTQKFGPHIIRQAHPAKQAEQDQEQGQAGSKDGAEDDQQVQLRHRAPDLDETLERQVRLAAKVPLNGSCQQPEQYAGGGQGQGKQHADPKTIDELGQQVATAIIRPQQIGAGRARRVGLGREVVQRLGAIRVGREDGPIAGSGESLTDEGVQVIGIGLEVATEGFLRIVPHHREIDFSLVTHQQRPVV